ncbi:MAG: hypothetical protein QM621_12620 [Aeromicrobium sp.]|uniref:hypothetical protein n=1 Tax=Aeromicrobium sp. TaxID=1871063 RepID=UPI0039E34490
MNNRSLDPAPVILPHLTVMIVLNLALQVVIAVDGHRIGAVAYLGTAVVAVAYAAFHLVRGRQLAQMRFGRLVAHVCGFITVNLGFHIHAAWLVMEDSPAIRGEHGFPLDDGWFGVLFGMFVFWGSSLVCHLIASIAQQGYEELHA